LFFFDLPLLIIKKTTKYIYKFRIIKRFVKRKLKLETGKKETLKSLINLLKWTDGKRNSIGYSDIFKVYSYRNYRAILSSLL